LQSLFPDRSKPAVEQLYKELDNVAKNHFSNNHYRFCDLVRIIQDRNQVAKEIQLKKLQIEQEVFGKINDAKFEPHKVQNVSKKAKKQKELEPIKNRNPFEERELQLLEQMQFEDCESGYSSISSSDWMEEIQLNWVLEHSKFEQ
jgi:hypothetical protein